MKIKTDFVTNSSSTCYIVMVPEKFKINDEILKASILECDDYYDGEDESEKETFESLHPVIVENLQDLKKGKDLYLDYDFSESHHFYVLREFLSKSKLVLKAFDTRGDGEDHIVAVSQNVFTDIILDTIEPKSIVKKEEAKKEKGFTIIEALIVFMIMIMAFLVSLNLIVPMLATDNSKSEEVRVEEVIEPEKLPEINNKALEKQKL